MDSPSLEDAGEGGLHPTTLNETVDAGGKWSLMNPMYLQCIPPCGSKINDMLGPLYQQDELALKMNLAKIRLVTLGLARQVIS